MDPLWLAHLPSYQPLPGAKGSFPSTAKPIPPVLTPARPIAKTGPSDGTDQFSASQNPRYNSQKTAKLSARYHPSPRADTVQLPIYMAQYIEPAGHARCKNTVGNAAAPPDLWAGFQTPAAAAGRVMR